MKIADINKIQGRRYPARRVTKPMIGQGLPVEAGNFCIGHVELEPNGGQVPWHNQEQEEAYFIIEGTCEMCLGEEKQILEGGQIVLIPSGVFHQLTNVGDTPARMMYIYSPAGDVDHWRQELAGTLPKEGVDVPKLPDGAQKQCTEKP